MSEKSEILRDVVTILLHPQTEIHDIEQTGVWEDVMTISVRFTAPLEADFASAEHDDRPKTTLNPRKLRLLGALAHSEAILTHMETPRASAMIYASGVAHFRVLRKPYWGHCVHKDKQQGSK